MSNAITETKYLRYKGCSDFEPTPLFKKMLASCGSSPAEVFRKMCFVIDALIEISCVDDGSGFIINEPVDIQSALNNLLCDLEMDLELELIVALMKKHDRQHGIIHL